MAEQPQRDRKSQLIAELERSRAELARSGRGVRRDLDVGAHLKHSILRQKTAWLTGAAVTGWALARLPGIFRKKKARQESEAPAARQIRQKEKERGGLLLAALSLAGTLLKPAITAFVSRKIADLASKNQPGNGAPPQFRRESNRGRFGAL